ncbi:MAG: TetR/AcrR family transcriptional regulator C-terminal domain-containing protein [Clostridiaceae bacterium]|jgi:probable dihydroxyacetone kinase regulator|nr:TetR/AcrR family transcriptional regulator C-terminal domain-containing protein [Clostridiaceae bacterium]
MPSGLSSEMTKKMLCASLKKLMARKPLHKISVREITEDCNVNRQTFYYHFEDIYSLLKWMYQEEAIKLLAEHEGILIWQDGLLQLFKYLEANKAVCLCTLDSIEHQHLKRLLYDDIHDIIRRAVFYFGEDIPDKSEEYGEFLTQFYTVALAGMVECWLRGEIKQTPEELIRLIDITLKDQIWGARERIGK